MSFRLTFALLTILVALGGYVFILTGNPEEEEGPSSRAQFYEIDGDAINRIAITYYGDRQVFVRAEPGDWRFDTVDGDPVGERFTGTSLLASGGLSDRVLVEDAAPEQLREYGLDAPTFEMEVRLETGETYRVSLGVTTPDGRYNYGQIEGDPQVYLMAQIWGEVLAEYVTDPPLPGTPVATGLDDF